MKRDLTVDVDGDVSGFVQSMKSAEASAKVFERELGKLEKRARDSAASVNYVGRLRAQNDREQISAAKQSARSMAHLQSIRNKYEHDTVRLAKKSAVDLQHVARLRQKYEQDEIRASKARMDAMEEAGRSVLMFGAAAAVGVGVAVKKFSDFDHQMGKVQAATQATSEVMAELREGALAGGQELGYTATETAGAIEYMAKAGVSARHILGGGMVASLSLAAAGAMEVEQAAEIAATAMVQFGLAGSDLPHVADLLASAATNAQGDVQDLGLALKQGGLVANQAGWSIEETTGILAQFANAGLIGSDAGTSMRTMLLHLMGPSDKAREKMEELGFSAYNAAGGFKSAQELAQEVQDKLGGLEKAEQDAALAIIFGMDAIRGSNVLMKAGAKGTKAWADEVNQSGFAAKAAAARLNNLNGDMRKFRASLERSLIGAGAPLNNTLRTITQFGTGAVNAFTALPVPAQQAAAAVATGAAAVGLLGGAALIAVPKVVAFRAALEGMGAGGAKLNRGLGLAASALTGPWGLAIGAGITIMGVFAASKAKAAAEVEGFVAAIQADSGAVGENTRVHAVAALTKSGALRAAERLGISTELVTDAVLGNSKAMREVTEATADYALEAEVAYELGHSGQKAKREDAAAARLLQNTLGSLNSQQRRAREDARRAADALGEEEEAVEGLESAIPGVESAVKELTDAQKKFAEGISSFSGPESTYEALLKKKEAAERATAEATAAATLSGLDSWEDYAKGATVSLGEFAAALEADNQAARDWQTNLVKIAQTSGADVAAYLAELGKDGIEQTALMANGTAEETKRMADAIRDNLALGTEDMGKELEAMVRIADSKGKLSADALARQLEMGVDRVREIAEEYGLELAEGLDPFLSSLGMGRTATGGFRIAGQDSVGGVSAYAEGGPVWGAGTATSDSIPAYLSNGEYVIQASSVQRYGQGFFDAVNAGAFAAGGKVVRRFARGGFASEGDVPNPPKVEPAGPVADVANAAMDLMSSAAKAIMRQASPQPSGGAGGPGSVAGDGELSSNAAAAKKLVLSQVAVPGGIGGWGRRNNPTDHDDYIDGKKASRALDFMTSNLALGNKILQILQGFPGSKYQIWQQTMYPKGRAPYRMGDRGNKTANHYDHVHASFFNKGGMATRRPRRFAAGGAVTPTAAATAAAVAAAAESNAERLEAVAKAAEARADAASDALNEQNKLIQENIRLQEAAQAVADAQRMGREAVNAAMRAEATEKLNEALAEQAALQKEISEDRAARSSRRAVDAANATAQQAREQAEAARKAADEAKKQLEERRQLEDNMHEAGAIGTAQYVAILDARIKSETAYTNEWMAQVNKRAQVLKEEADWLLQIEEERKEAADEARETYDDALQTMNDLLDEERDVRREMVQVEEDYAEEMGAIRRKMADSTKEYNKSVEDAARDFNRSQQQILDARRTQLESWARLDEAVTGSWGNTVGQLLDNARSQAAQFKEWMAELETARSRGVSEQVISMLGLDEGPQALAQLKQFNSATISEINALNAEVAARTAAADSQVRTEQAKNLGTVGKELTEVQERYAETLRELRERFVEEQRALEDELTKTQSDFVIEQAELATKLAAIGLDQGRSYGAALAEGLNSQLEGVRAAAAALRKAASGAASAGLEIPGVKGGVAAPGAPPKGTAGSFKLGGKTVHVNEAGIIDTPGPLYGKYPSQVTSSMATGAPGVAAPGAPPLGTAGSFLLDGKMVHVNTAGIIDTPGPLYGKYPAQVKTYDRGGWLEPGYTLAYNGTGRPERVVTQSQMVSGGTGGVTVNINAPVFGVDQLHQVVRGGVESALNEKRNDFLIGGSLG